MKDVTEFIKKLCKEDKSGNYRGRILPEQHPSFSEYPTVHEFSTICGAAQKQMRTGDFRQAREAKVQNTGAEIFCAEDIARIRQIAIKKQQRNTSNQLQEDNRVQQNSFKENLDPFTGSKNSKAQAEACKSNAVADFFGAH